MSKQEHLRKIAKDHGVVALAKMLVDDQDAHGISEAELTALIGEYDRQPGESAAKCFARHYGMGDRPHSPESALLRKAMAVAKAMPFVADFTPMVVGGADARDVHPGESENEAIRQLKQIGAQKWPTASEAQQFARALTDPENAELASKAHVRPSPTTSYPFPR